MRPGGQREKGKTFERAIAAQARLLWPDAIIRRGSQAERADNSDVFFEHGPSLLKKLWLELQDAANPTPMGKMLQAEGDIASVKARGGNGDRYAIVIWHKLRERKIQVTMRSKTYDDLRRIPPTARLALQDHALITMQLEDFFSLLQALVVTEGETTNG